MNIEHFLKRTLPPWIEATDEHADIVISTRIRLARNLRDTRFPASFSEEDAKQIDDTVLQALLSIRNEGRRFSYFPMKEMPTLQRQVLVEKHLISPYLANCEKTASVFLTEDESMSVMVNEEDHIRIQCLAAGLQLHETYTQANELDQYLEGQLMYAYDGQLGFLTSCPTNVGTGLRASVMMHLPALTMTKRMNVLIQTMARLGMVVRGIYGEGSENLGNIYQISNQITLGKSERDILDDLQNVVEQIIQKEHEARKQLFARAPIALEDRLYRSLGTLMYARILSSEEAASCLSNVRLAVGLQLISDISLNQLNECMLLIQPGFIQQYAGTTLQTTERDIFRSKLLQEKLATHRRNEPTNGKGEDLYDV
ncbi:protein arginine kinase [Lysinibacillus sp. KU-BSD001]|uniref:protein arginine kinase n=1 Tax=Lysinibacillus sp. KU-BSD001 TaxID=3141328 RepID=UPI0036DFB9D9